jgi:hypothetical protein
LCHGVGIRFPAGLFFSRRKAALEPARGPSVR